MWLFPYTTIPLFLYCLEYIVMNNFSTECILGPSHWKEVFPIANGDRQSPIDIRTEDTKYDPTLRPLKPNYDPTSAKVILNNGHSTSVEFDDTENRSGLFYGRFNSTCTPLFSFGNQVLGIHMAA